MSGSIRAVSRVGSATAAMMRGTEAISSNGGAARVSVAVASMGSASVGVQTPARTGGVAFSAVLSAGSSTAHGSMAKARGVYLDDRTMECQEQLAAQRNGQRHRETEQLRQRLDAALDGSEVVPVNARLHGGARFLPAHGSMLLDA